MTIKILTCGKIEDEDKKLIQEKNCKTSKTKITSITNGTIKEIAS